MGGVNDQQPGAQRPESRYGRAPRKRTRLVVAAYVVGIVVAIALLAWAAFVQFSQPVSWEVRTFDVPSEEAIEVTFEVRREDGAATECLLSAQAHDHAVVGETVVRIPAGEGTVWVTHTIETERLAVIATVESCEITD